MADSRSRGKHLAALVLGLGLLGWPALQAASSSTQPEPDQATKVRVSGVYNKLPLSFEANEGQTNDQVKFLSRGSGYSLFLTPTEAVLVLRKAEKPSAVSDQLRTRKRWTGKAALDLETQNSKLETVVVRMKLVGANPMPRVAGLNELPGKINYFIGNEPKNWSTNVPTYARVEYQDVYPGVNLVYYGNQRQLEYDLIVNPGADPEAIRLTFEGVDKLRIDAQGDLILQTREGEIRQKRPLIYQEVEGVKQAIPGRYVLNPKSPIVGFQLAAYDRSKALVIDPVLTYSTYLGGSSDDAGNGIAVDSSGNAYIAGYTSSANFPTASPFQAAKGAGFDAFVTKLNAAGSALVYSTYLGGSSDDAGFGIAVDSSGNAYITGYTISTNFPTASPFQAAKGAGFDAFVAKLNPTGSALLYSTYLGGSGFDRGNSIALDSSGNAYVTGSTGSTNFPTASPLQPAISGNCALGCQDAFVTKLNATGSALVYSTFLGGSGSDQGNGIAVDSSGNAYVTGDTTSLDFPTATAFQANGASSDAFVTKLNAAGALVYSTYLGGSVNDHGCAIAVDSSGNAYVTGDTNSSDFPTASAFQPAKGGLLDPSFDAFVTKLNAAGFPVYSTFLGGSSDDHGCGIAVDSCGNAYVTGTTNSANFPIVDPSQAFLAGSFDAFVAKLNPTGSTLLYSTYLGGSGSDQGNSIAVDSCSNAYVTCVTDSPGLSTLGAFQPFIGGGTDVCIAKFSTPVVGPTVTLSLSGSPMAEAGGVATVTATLSALSGQNVTVNLAFSGTATLNTDYTVSGSSISILAGNLTGSITLTAVQDSLDEANETIVVDISTVINATESGTQQVTATITDDDPLPSLSINDVSVTEGNAGTVNAVFTVSLSPASGQTVTVNFATADNTATAPSDYVATSGTRTFSPGVTTQTITVVVNGDTLNEANETFFVNLSGATNATIADSQGVGTITNDDPVPSGADLSITKTDSPDPVLVGNNLTYTITVTNNGPSNATGVTVTDTLPAGTTFVSATPTQGSCTGTTTVTCSLGTLTNGSSATVTIVVTPTVTGTLSNTASVTGAETDPNTPNNTTAPQNTTVNPKSDLSITKADSPDPVNPGGTLTYTITVTNSGPSTASTVTVTDTLPSGVTFVSASGTGWSCTGTITVTCTRATLAVGAAPAITIVVNVNSNTTGTLTNTASVSSPTTDPAPGNNSASAATTVTSTAMCPVTIDFAALGAVGNVGSSSLVNSNLTLFARTLIPATGSSLTGGLQGTIFIGQLGTQDSGVNVNNCPSTGTNCGVGVQNANKGGSKGISGEGGDQDESLIFDFTASGITANSVTVGLIGLNCLNGTTGTNCSTNDIISVEIDFVSATDQVIANANSSVTTSGSLGSLAFSNLSIPGSAEVDRFAIRATEGHFGVTGISFTGPCLPVADLAISKTDSPDPVVVGSNLTYTVVVTNNGPSAATGVTMTDTLPSSYVTFVSATPTQGTCSGTSTVSCNLGTIANGGSATVTIVVKPKSTAKGKTITNTASVKSNETDPNTANNNATATTKVN